MRLALPLLLATALAAATPASAEIRTDHDPGARFTGRTTFAWQDSKGLAQFREDEPFLEKAVQAALRKELESKGLRLVESGDADLLVTYRETTKERMSVLEDPDFLPRRSWCPDVHVQHYDEVTYIIDVSDGATKELMWRGWVSEPQAAPERMKQQAARLIAKLMKRYPPG